jgi:single-strand DNA-binding protein
MAFCKLMFIGNLGRDPEMRYTPTGKPVTQFTVAVNQSTRNQQTGEWTEDTDWFRVSVFGDRAERAAEQLRKGNRVFVEGRFRSREFEGQDGQKRTSLDVTADNVISLEKRPRDEEGSFSGAPAAAASGAPAGGVPAGGFSGGGGGSRPPADDTDIDDLPF